MSNPPIDDALKLRGYTLEKESADTGLLRAIGEAERALAALKADVSAGTSCAASAQRLAVAAAETVHYGAAVAALNRIAFLVPKED